MFFGDERRVGKHRDEQALAFEREINLREIGTEERLAAGDETPHGAKFHRLIGNVRYFGDGKFARARVHITRREIDVTVAAIVVAPRGHFEVERQRHALVFEFVPERELLNF